VDRIESFADDYRPIRRAEQGQDGDDLQRAHQVQRGEPGVGNKCNLLRSPAFGRARPVPVPRASRRQHGAQHEPETAVTSAGVHRGRRARSGRSRRHVAAPGHARGSPTHCEPTAATPCHGRLRPTPRRGRAAVSTRPSASATQPRRKRTTVPPRSLPPPPWSYSTPASAPASAGRPAWSIAAQRITWCRYGPDGSGGPVSWRCAACLRRGPAAARLPLQRPHDVLTASRSAHSQP
jgi:hypothetical protein